ncbi:MAG: class I SAM-dependent DNA methyltransferase [Candidatus Competibacteraceae bacterium]|nr:class I SAM-dependent DNA methyltransferase [Candidatus Competibacteraceae bacterium]
MTPEKFIDLWRENTLKERSGSQSHFNQLCDLLGVIQPAIADPHGEWFTFEKGAKKTGGGDGWADVWKKDCFAWEYKGKHKDLSAALRQLQQYALALDNPPLLIVSDMATIEIHTHFTNTVHTVRRLALEDLADPAKLQLLKWAFTEPERLKPTVTRQKVTEDAATILGGLAQRLRQRGHPPLAVAHFMTRLLFCLFAEDIGLLPHRLFSGLLARARPSPAEFLSMAGDLFRAMHQGGHFGLDKIAWFDGGLFDDAACLPLQHTDLDTLHSAAALDWSEIEPAIFGTLFERGLDPDKRSQLGAHYTDAGSIERLIVPVIRDPLLAEWATVKTDMARLLAAKKPKRTQAEQVLQHFLERLHAFRVLDPACGSGNFLYVALRTLKDLEHQVMLEAEALGLQRGFPAVGPEAVAGIEINDYAAELARLTVWIGEIQWMIGHGYNLNEQPILKPLNQILCRDALLNDDGIEATWPATTVIVGNPPFLGDKKQLAALGDAYIATLRQTYQCRVPGAADLVCYWFEKARVLIEAGHVQRAGLVATNSIRGGANRKVLERILNTASPLTGEGGDGGEKLAIFNAWSDQEWFNEGAAVRVSLVCFGKQGHGQPVILDGQSVTAIHADLKGRKEGDNGSLDLTQAKPLLENAGVSFIGTQKNGPFNIAGDLARQWLKLPNPNGRPNSDVLHPWANGMDINRRYSDTWIIDFGVSMPEAQAALYEAPFEYSAKYIKPLRVGKREDRANQRWWLMQRSRPELRTALQSLGRFIATSMVSKYRFFVWLDKIQLPENLVVVIARDDDTTFGILHSRFHELWALRTCTWLGKGNDSRYTPTTCFETFPFPDGLQPNIPASAYVDDPRAQVIAAAAQKLNELRDNWLNPPQWVDRLPEVVPGYPDRLIPKPEHAAELKKRTLTNLYNQRPAWLANAHRDLDHAVAAAYGWPVDLSDDEVLRRLLALNRERAV